MFVVGQRNISIVSNNTVMKMKSNVDSDHDQNETHVKIKINKSDIFDENRRKLKTWLIQIKLYFKFNRVADEDKMTFATTYFCEQAEHWIQFMLKKYLNENRNVITLFYFSLNSRRNSNEFSIFSTKNKLQNESFSI